MWYYKRCCCGLQLTPEEAEVIGAKLKPPEEKPTLETEFEVRKWNIIYYLNLF